MGELTVWGRLSSCNVQKVIWVLEELSLPYEHIPLGGEYGGNMEPDYLAINPHGRVPTLRDGDTIVWESDAIVRYLCARYDAGGMWPEPPAERAIADQWATWGTTELLGDWINLFWRLVRTPEEKRNPAAISRHLDASSARFKLLNDQLEGHDYVVGNSLTIADISTGMTLYRWFSMDIERPETPNLEAWYARLCERPAYKAGVCVPYDDLIGRESF